MVTINCLQFSLLTSCFHLKPKSEIKKQKMLKNLKKQEKEERKQEKKLAKKEKKESKEKVYSWMVASL